LAGGVALMAAMFAPWWGITQYRVGLAELRGPDAALWRDRQKRHREIVTENRDFYRRIDHAAFTRQENFLRARQTMRETGKMTGWLWGWETTSGIVCLVLGLPGVILGALPLSIRAIRRWSWIGCFVACGCGLVTAPSEDVQGVMSQGVLAGPFVALGAGTVLSLAGLFGGIAGLKVMAQRVEPGRLYR